MIYLASSWCNAYFDGVATILTAAKLPFYNFKRPDENTAFHWSDISPTWQDWPATQYRDALSHPLAEAGFKTDMDALKACDRLVLVLPCGRSAHLELGYAIGAGKETIIYCPERQTEPELMYKAANHLCLSMDELLDKLGVPN